MLTLAIDTSSNSGSLAVLRDEQLLGVLGATSDENYSSRLFRQLGILLNELRLELPAVDLYAVAAGPGSFTGLRVGLAAVKGWAEVYGKPVAAVSALEAVAIQYAGPERWIAPLLDARRGQVFGALFERRSEGLHRIQEERVESISELLAWLQSELGTSVQGKAAFITPIPALLGESFKASLFAHCPISTASPLLAPHIGLLGAQLARCGRTIDALHLDANYVRRPDAELNFKVTGQEW